MYKAVVFDFDYTLGDSTNGIVLSVEHALAGLGYMEKTVDEIRRTIGLSLAETFSQLTGIEDEEQAKRFTKLFVEKADEVMTDNSVLYDGVTEGLRRLNSLGIKTAIVTTKFHYRIEQILSKFNAINLIYPIIGGEDVKRQKPAPDGILLAAERLGLEKREMLYVGDSHVDARAAQSAGVDFAAVLTGTTVDFSHLPCVFVGKTVRDIFDFVTKI